MVSSGILRFSLAEQSCLTCLHATNQNQGANAFAAFTFLVWPARRRILQRPVCHLAARNDDNAYHRVGFPTPFKLHDLLLTQHYYYLDVVLWKNLVLVLFCALESKGPYYVRVKIKRSAFSFFLRVQPRRHGVASKYPNHPRYCNWF